MGFSDSEKSKILAASPDAEVFLFDQISSTNAVLSEMARQGAPEKTVVAADSQTQGRGRLGRRWISPPGGLFISFLFRPALPIAFCPTFTFMSSLALLRVFRSFGISAEIKWPNDITVAGKKTAGVLCETSAGGEFPNFVIIGIGANINFSRAQINSHMKGFSESVTSVSESLGREADRGRFAAELIRAVFAEHEDFLSKGANFTVARWVAEWGKINCALTIQSGGGRIEGTARKVDARGFLYLETPDGELKKITAADLC